MPRQTCTTRRLGLSIVVALGVTQAAAQASPKPVVVPMPTKAAPVKPAPVKPAPVKPAPAKAAENTRKLRLVTFNDFYEIQPVGGLGGAARVASLVRRLRAQEPATLVLFAGDLLSPSVMSSVFKGQQMISALNGIGVDYATIGNHELDFGLPVLKARLAESKSIWLSANIIESATGAPVPGTQADALVTVGNVKVGLFGLAYDFTPILSNKDEVKFLDPIATAQAEVARLRKQGAEYVVVLSHQDAADDCALSKQVPGIDFIVGGHDHAAMLDTDCGNAPFIKATSDARNIWSVDADLSGKSPVYAYANLPVSAALPEDPRLARTVAGYAAELDADFGRTIGQADVALDATQKSVRGRESNLGDLIADAVRAAAGSDIGVMNGGSIRSDRSYPVGAVTKKDIFTILPFGNTLVVVQASGAVVRQMIENSVSQIESGAGRFLQVSGMTYRFDPALPSGKRVTDISVGGQPLDEARTYSVAINDYLYSGGDGYSMLVGLPAGTEPSEGPLLAQIVSDAIAKAGHVAPMLDGRITIR